MVVKLKNYQKKAVRATDHFKGRILIADDMGLGKTVEALAWVYAHPELKPIIIVTPSSAKYVWEQQAAEHFGLRTCVLEGRKPHTGNGFNIHNIFILNYEILAAWSSYLLKLNPAIMIIDEVHYIKNPKAQRTKITRYMGGKIDNVLALSGTPATSRPIELFPVLNMLKPNIFDSFYKFAFRYCQPRRNKWGWDYKGAVRLPELHKLLKRTCMIRRLKEDVLSELPPKTRKVVPLPIENRNEYQRILKDFLLWFRQTGQSPKDKIGMKKLKQAQNLVKLGYLKRIAAELKMKYVIQWIEDFLEQSDGKLVIFCEHKKIAEILMYAFKEYAILVDGSVRGRNRVRAVRQFQTKKKTRLLVGKFKTAGVSIDLTVASTLAFVELDFVPGNHTQAEDRIHRLGQKEKSFIYYLVAKDTIEEDLCKIIEKKQVILDKMLNGKTTRRTLDVYEQLLKQIGGGE